MPVSSKPPKAAQDEAQVLVPSREPPKRSYTRRRAQTVGNAEVEAGPKPEPTIIEAAAAMHREQALGSADDAVPTMIDRSLLDEDDDVLPPELAEFKEALLRASRPSPRDDESEELVDASQSGLGSTMPLVRSPHHLASAKSGPVAKTVPLVLRAASPSDLPPRAESESPAGSPKPEPMIGRARRADPSETPSGPTLAERPAASSGEAPPSGFFEDEPKRVSAARGDRAPAPSAVLKTRQLVAARVEDVTGEQRIERPVVPAALRDLTTSSPPAPSTTFRGAVIAVVLALVLLGAVVVWFAMVS